MLVETNNASNNIIIANNHHKIEFKATGEIIHNKTIIANDKELYEALRTVILGK